MNHFFSLLQKYAVGKTILILFIVTMSIYLTMIFYSIPLLQNFLLDLALFDLAPFGYSYDDAISLLDTLGTEGRSIYLTVQLPLDFLYPGLFAITYSLLLIWLMNKTGVADTKIIYMSLVPIFAGVFDYLENIFIIIMIYSFPDVLPITVELASIATILKSIFTSIFFVFLFLLGFKLVRNK